MDLNEWTSYNDKMCLLGPRRGGKTTIISIFILLLGLFTKIEGLIFSKTKPMSQNVGKCLHDTYAKLCKVVPGLKIITDNHDGFSFSRYEGHVSSYLYRPGRAEISFLHS